MLDTDPEPAQALFLRGFGPGREVGVPNVRQCPVEAMGMGPEPRALELFANTGRLVLVRTKGGVRDAGSSLKKPREDAAACFGG